MNWQDFCEDKHIKKVAKKGALDMKQKKSMTMAVM